MDGSNFSPGDLDALIDKYMDEIIEEGTTDQINQFLDIVEQFYRGCDCGCRGARHMQEAWQIFQKLRGLRSPINIPINDYE